MILTPAPEVKHIVQSSCTASLALSTVRGVLKVARSSLEPDFKDNYKTGRFIHKVLLWSPIWCSNPLHNLRLQTIVLYHLLGHNFKEHLSMKCPSKFSFEDFFDQKKEKDSITKQQASINHIFLSSSFGYSILANSWKQMDVFDLFALYFT